MLKLNILFILVGIFLLINQIKSLEPASSVVYTAIIYDHHPSKNVNFESKNGDGSKGMVKTALDTTTRVPTLSNNNAAIEKGCVTDPSTFQYFFTSKTGMNIPIPYNITLTRNADGVYSYSNSNFFPLDNKGWDSSTYSSLKLKRYSGEGGTYHNFHYCLKLNNKFTYQGIETFQFNGDDDVWVYINNKLAVDIGGIHVNQEGSVDLQTLGLTIGNTYNFDFFYCERHTVNSNMKIQTNIETFCAKTDYCGVCQGTGTDCCSPDLCEGAAANPCREYKCPAVDAPGVTSSNYLSKCTYTNKTCPTIDICTNNQCSLNNGSCLSSPIVCDDKESQCLTNKKCTVPSGCSYVNKCLNNACLTGACDGSGNCVAKNCDGGNKCKVYSCDSKTGCSSKDLCQPSSNVCETPVCYIENGVGKCRYDPIVNCTQCTCASLGKCQLKTCDTKTGQCVPVPISTEDGNACTIGTCDPNTGIITQSLNVTCGSCQTCDSKSGKCVDNLSQCEDGNVCTIKKCDPVTGDCASDPVSCDDGDACTLDACDTLKGCTHTLITCKNADACNIGYCDKVKGCQTKKKECTSPAFCIVAECDATLGCISYDRRCVPDNPRCQKGICNNETAECEQKEYDPKPFICNTKAVVSTSVIAGVTVAGAVAVGLAVFGGKKGYDYWKESKGNKVSMANSNPLYEQNPNAGAENPLYTANNS